MQNAPELHNDIVKFFAPTTFSFILAWACVFAFGVQIRISSLNFPLQKFYKIPGTSTRTTKNLS
jgi:hypothetical protein